MANIYNKLYNIIWHIHDMEKCSKINLKIIAEIDLHKNIRGTVIVT